MLLTEQHIIKRSDKRFAELDHISFLSKNLYNAGLYAVRQHFFAHGRFLNYQALQKQFAKENNPDYRALPAKVSQQVLMNVEGAFKSFFALRKKDLPAKMPNYLNKEGRYVATYTSQAMSKVKLKHGFLSLSSVSATVKTDKSPRQARLVHKGTHIIVEVIHEVEEPEMRPKNGNMCGLDLGLNNLATVGGIKIRPFIISGRPLKSINQYWNREIARLKSCLEKNRYSSAKIAALNRKRNAKVKDYLHKASRTLVNQLATLGVDTLVVGHNQQWKQDINIGKKNNQNFVQIPHSYFIDMLTYKCRLVGIEVIRREESYTSKCSFMDNEPIKKAEKYEGRRIKRGLFRTKNGKFINADLNAALNILRKEVGEFQYSIEVCSTPVVQVPERAYRSAK
jgi:IS605 OrfB family transposase